MATLQGKAVKNTYRQVLQIGANNVGVSGTLQPVQDGTGTNTSLSLSTTAATVTGDLTITGDLIITGGGIQIQDLIDDTVASLIQNGTGITWAYNDTLRTLTPTITIATADGGAQADYLQLNTGAGEANAVAKIYWNSTDGTAELGLMGGQVVLPIGQKQVARVLNNSGTIFTKAGYQVVKITAAQGQRLAVGLAQANNDANSTDTLGLVAENISNNQEGFVTTSGLITNVDTTGDLQLEDWNDGDILYLSPTTPGAITKVKPVAPQHTIIVGFVVYSHKNNGKIYVKVDNGYELDELHNVKITSVADNNILQYNSSLGVWENVAGTTTNLAEGTNLYYTQGRFDSAFAAKTTTNLAEGTNLYFTETRATNNFDTNLAASTTTDLAEGTNLYYTNTRARLALDVTAGTGISYNNGTGVFTLGSIPNASLTNSSITINSQAVSLGGSVTLTTTNIAEGTNLYWTDARFDSRFGTKTTTNLAEGTNLYYTQARFNTAFDAKTTTDLDEGTNLYYTDARARAAFSENAVGLDYSSGSGVLSLTSGYAIPTTVKLGEYDTAYNRSLTSAAVTGTSTKTLTLTKQDASTITASWTDQGITTINGTANQIATSTAGNTTTVGFTNDVTFPNNVVVSGNLTINGTATYVNTQSVSTKDPLIAVANTNTSSDAVDIGLYGEYYDTAQTRLEYTGIFRDASDSGKFKIFSGLVDEPTNVVNTSGVGYTTATLVANVEGTLSGNAGSATVLQTSRSISATGDASWTVNFNGSANATAALTLANTGVTASTYGTTTSVPTIAIDSKGRITSASNTNIAFPVTSVNGASGTVVLTTSNIAEGSNQYFTSARAQAAISGTAPISVTSGVVSISQAGIATNGYLSSTDWNTFNDKLPAAGATSITTLGTIGTGTWNGTSIGVGYGGTGIASYVVGDLLYASGTAELSKLADVATGNALISGGVGVAPSWGKIGLDTHVSGVLPVANGGTGSATQNFVDLTTAQTIGGAKTFSSGITANGGYSYLYGLRISGNDTGNTIYSGNASIGITADSGNRIFIGQVGSSTIGLNVMTATGNVGINVSNPVTAKLNIAVANSATNVGGIDITNGANASFNVSLRTDITEITAGGTGNMVFSNSVERLRLTSGGQLGLGVIPKTWWGSRRALEINNGGAYAGVDNGWLEMWGNSYLDSTATSKYLQNGYATLLQAGNTTDGGYTFNVAPYATANSNVTYITAMRILASGNTLLGLTSEYAGYRLQVAGANSTNSFASYFLGGGTTSNGINIYLPGNRSSDTTYSAIALGDDVSYRFRVYGNGNVVNTNNSYGSLSDIKLKENITDAKPKLDDLLKVKIRNYNLIGDDTKQIGVIAQELEEVFPSMIDESEDFEEVEVTDEEGNITKERQSLGTTTKSVKYSVFTIINTKAIQELKTEKDAEIAELRNQIEELKALIAAK